MFGTYFYHAAIRRTISVFGTLFNNINIRKTDANGKILQEIKVPLAYGPRQKFLARVQNQTDLSDPKLAIKLPRLSFEITSITYDTNQTVNKSNEIRVGSIVNNTRKTTRTLGLSRFSSCSQVQPLQSTPTTSLTSRANVIMPSLVPSMPTPSGLVLELLVCGTPCAPR